MPRESRTTIDAALQRILAQVPQWQDRPLRIEPLPGGLTNTNYRVEVDGRSFVLRISGASTDLLAIDRANEHHNTRVAAELGIGPAIVHQVPDDDAVVLEHLPGRTLSKADLHAPAMPRRVAEALRRLHSGPAFLSDFNMLRLADYYLELIRRERFDLPPGFEKRRRSIEQVDAALASDPPPAAPCHNDLLAENFIDDGEQLRIVDFEYSGNNDPCFELGNFCQEQEYDDRQIAELVAAYFGQATPRNVARVKLNMIVSDVGWALWATIQRRISKLDFDFATYGLNRWRRAEAKLDGPEFDAWLRDARSRDR